MILGVTGTLGAGKGTVVEYLKGKGFAHYSSSATLKALLTEQGLPLTRPYMSQLAHDLMQEFPGGVLQISYERAHKDGAKDFILEAIHRESEAAYVRSIGGIIWGVDADLRTRYERTHRRADGAKDDVTFEEFAESSKREDEGAGTTGANIRAVLRSADVVFINNGTLEELHAQIDTALSKR